MKDAKDTAIVIAYRREALYKLNKHIHRGHLSGRSRCSGFACESTRLALRIHHGWRAFPGCRYGQDMYGNIHALLLLTETLGMTISTAYKTGSFLARSRSVRNRFAILSLLATLSLFPSFGYTVGYRVSQRIYNFRGQHHSNDVLNTSSVSRTYSARGTVQDGC